MRARSRWTISRVGWNPHHPHTTAAEAVEKPLRIEMLSCHYKSNSNPTYHSITFIEGFLINSLIESDHYIRRIRRAHLVVVLIIIYTQRDENFTHFVSCVSIPPNLIRDHSDRASETPPMTGGVSLSLQSGKSRTSSQLAIASIFPHPSQPLEPGEVMRRMMDHRCSCFFWLIQF